MYEIDPRYLIEQTVRLCRTPSPSGYTQRAMALVDAEFRRLGIAVRYTKKGALVATLGGPDGVAPRTLAAHVDTLGAMVKEIKSNGRLKLTQIGGYGWSTIEGEYCLVHTATGQDIPGTVLLHKASYHVFGQEQVKAERNADTMEVRLDARVQNADDVRNLGIAVGDFISLDPRTSEVNGFIKSRHLDNKLSVAIFLELARLYRAGQIRPAATTHLFVSNYEETGHGASAGIPPETAELVALDMAAVGEGQTSDEYSVTVCVKDSTGPYDYGLSRRLVDLAAARGVPCRVDIYPFYGSDASAALRAGGEFRAALIGPGIDASHSYERVHIDALVHTTVLAAAYVETPYQPV